MSGRGQDVDAGQQGVHGWMPLIAVALGLSMIVMDVTIVNTSLPDIVRDLDMNSIDAQWVQSMYTLVFAALLITSGRLGDRYGRRTIFLIGCVIFGFASFLATQVDSGGALIAVRALQGVGGAMLSPTSLSLLNSMYFGRRRSIAFAIYGAVLAGMGGVGPLLGGYLTEYYTWRLCFGVNVPFAALTIVLALVFVPNTRDTSSQGLDPVGAVLSAIGIGAFVFGLIEGRGYGWFTALQDVHLAGTTWPSGGLSPVPVAFAVALAAIVALVRLEESRRRRGAPLLVDMTLFKIRSFAVGAGVLGIVSFGEFGLLFALPLFMQNALGYEPLHSGAITSMIAVGALVAGATGAMVAVRVGPRFTARLGLAVEVTGILALGIVVSATVPQWKLMACLVVVGLGLGYAQSQLASIILGNVPVNESGQASGTESTARRIGTAMGSAVLGTILFVTLQNATEHRVSEVPGVTEAQASEIGKAVNTSSGTAIEELAARPGGEPVAQAARVGFADAVRTTAFVAGGLVLVGLGTTALLPPTRPEDHGVSGRRKAQETADAGS